MKNLETLRKLPGKKCLSSTSVMKTVISFIMCILVVL